MNKVFRLVVLLLFIGSSISAQQFYRKDIVDVKTDLVKTVGTSEGGFLVLSTFPQDTFIFQLIKYDTCGLIEWANVYSDTLADSTAQPLIIVDEADNAKILYLDNSTDSSNINIIQTNDKGVITNQASISTNTKIENLGHAIYDEMHGLIATANTINANDHITYLFNVDVSNTLSWVQSSEDQFHGVSIYEDSILVSSYHDETDSTVHIESINVNNGTHQWRKEINNFKAVSNIVIVEDNLALVGQLDQGVTDTADHALIKLDVDGEVQLTSELFPSDGNGSLFLNQIGLLLVHYDRDYEENDGTETLNFNQFNANGDIIQQYFYDDIGDTLRHGAVSASILADKVNMSVVNYGTNDSTINFLYVGKISAQQNFSFGMGCFTEPYEQRDTAIMISSDSVGLTNFNEPSWTMTQKEAVNSHFNQIQDSTICQQTPMSSEIPSPHCIGERIDYFDRISGKTLVITSDTTVITNQYMFCGNLITESLAFTFAAAQTGLPLPKAFTPNNDGSNDDFGVITDTMSVLQLNSFDMRIYNRWGNKVFESSDINKKWDGNHDSKPAIPGVYIYYVAYKGKLGECDIDEVIKGDVTLIR